MFLEICPFFSDCSICWHRTICISLIPVISPLSFVIFFTWVLSFLLVNLAKSLSILFVFSKKQLLVSLFFFKKICFPSDLYYFLPFSDRHFFVVLLLILLGSSLGCLFSFFLSFFLPFFVFSSAALMAHWGSQAGGPIGAIAAGLRQSHSNAGSEPHLRPTPQLTATPNP